MSSMLPQPPASSEIPDTMLSPSTSRMVSKPSWRRSQLTNG